MTALAPQLYNIEATHSTHEAKMKTVMQFVGSTLPQNKLPYNEELEVTLIAHILDRLDLKSFVACSRVIQSGDFYFLRYGLIWQSMLDCFTETTDFDLVTLADYMETKSANGKTWLENISFQGAIGREAINLIVEWLKVSIVGRELEYADKIKELSSRRALMQTAYNTFFRAMDRETPFTEVSQFVLDDTHHAIGSAIQTEATSLSDLLQDYYEDWKQRVELAANGVSMLGLPTQILSVDAVIKGIHKGDVTYIGGLNSMGKTTIQLQVLYDTAKAGGRVVFFSLEMDKKKVINRLISLETGISVETIRNFTFKSREEVEKVNKAIKTLGELDFILIDKYRAFQLSPALLKIELQYYLTQAPISLVGIDGLWLMRPDGDFNEEKPFTGYETICARLASIARDFNLPIWITHQLNNNYQKRQIKTPIMSDFKGGMAIRNNADVVLFLYRESHPEINIPTETPDLTYVIVGKTRDGSGLGRQIKTRFDGEAMRFRDWL